MDHRINPHSGSRLRRLAALTPIAIGVVLVGCAVAAAAPRHLATSDPNPTPGLQTAAEEEPEEEVEWEWDESEEEIEVELEYEEGEESEEPSSLPPECLLRTAEPHVVVNFNNDDLQLSLRYTSDSAVRASVAYWLKGAKGAARLGSTTRRLDRRGVLEMSRHLDGRTLAKLRAARMIVVRVDIPGTPGSCKPYLNMRLTAQRILGRSATWYRPA
jgi:hypothetical protein